MDKVKGLWSRHQRGENETATVISRIGSFCILVLVSAYLVTLLAISFLLFLWFSHTENQIWHLIIVRQWATRAVAIASLVIRTVVGIQSGAAAGMLSALFLESGYVRLEHAAEFSMARASMPQPSSILYSVLANAQKCNTNIATWMRTSGVVVLCLTTLIMQFCSTILLSDLQLGALPGLSRQVNESVDFYYNSSYGLYNSLPTGWSNFYETDYPMQQRATTWSRSPIYTTFAEYSEPAVTQPGVDDTGPLLRAFLPFPDAQSRENLRNYTGKALVLDSRVSCQAPNLAMLALHTEDNGLDGLQGVLTGNLKPSTATERLWTPSKPVPFNCTLMAFWADQIMMVPPTICQLQGQDFDEGSFFGSSAGGLFSEFANITDFSHLQGWLSNRTAVRFVTWGTPFLVLNASRINEHASTNYSVHPTSNYSMAMDKTLSFEVDGPWTKVSTKRGPFNITASICYTAWDIARLNVTMSSTENRTEPVAYWRSTIGLYTVPDAIAQLGRALPGKDQQTRGIMKLHRMQSWIPTPEDAVPFTVMPFVQSFADANGPIPAADIFMSPNVSVVLYYSLDDYATQDLGYFGGGYAVADQNLAMLFNQVYTSSRSLARAMSSLVTVLSSMAYYDQMPRFSFTAGTEQVFFVTVLRPQSRLGLVTVCAILLVHNIVITMVVIVFAIQSRHTILGSYWHAVARLETPQTKSLREKALSATDREVGKMLKATDQQQARFRLARGSVATGESQIELIERSHAQRRSRSGSPAHSERSALSNEGVS